jgi:putative DNA primase/helicase
VCLSLLGSTQPGRIGSYLRAACTGDAGDDGLIQRFGLLVWPDTLGDWRDVDRAPNAEAKRVAFELFDYLDKASGFDLGGQQGQYEETPFLRFDSAGLELFQQWRRDLEARLRSEQLHPALESHLAKYRKTIPGLALALHLAGRGTGPVSEKATLQALAWAEFLESHAARAYASVTMADVSAAKAILARLRKGDLPRTFAGRDIRRKGWAHLSDRQTIADALSLLVDLDWLSERRRETDGRTATVYDVNPRAIP